MEQSEKDQPEGCSGKNGCKLEVVSVVSGPRQDEVGMKKKEEIRGRQGLKYSKTSCTEDCLQGSHFCKDSTQQSELSERAVTDVLRVACSVFHHTLRHEVFQEDL